MIVNEFWKIPFFRFILPFIGGVITATAFELNQLIFIVLTALFTGLSLVYRPFLNHELSYHNRWIFGALISLALFFAGASLTCHELQYSDGILKSEKVIGVISKPIKETAKSVKLEVNILEYRINQVWVSEKSTILVYLEKDSIANSLQYGDLLLLDGGLKEIQNSGNPNEFDYKTYLLRKKIHFQTYKSAGSWKKLASGKGNIVYSAAYWLRNRTLQTYLKTGIKGDEYAILAALTLGVKDYLSDEIIEAYSDSGAMHVLAVSGLHVGIIMLVLTQLLFFMQKPRSLFVIQSILIICFIWLFAFITGLAPSVTRASIMLTFIIVGKNSNRNPSIYNSIAASAFFILLFNPLAFFNVGFQLSYLAVISIVFFQARIYRFFDIKNKGLDKVWQLTSVSIAAQIGTTPISIFYFHQFPIYALITNLIAIPAAFLIMYGAIILLISSSYMPVAKMIAVVLSFILEIFNKSTAFIENLPMASIKYISLSNFELIFLYVALTMLLFFIFLKKKMLIFLIFIFCIIVFSLRDYRYFSGINTKKFIVFNSKSRSSFATIANKSMTFYSDSSLINDNKSISYLTSNIRTTEFIKDMKRVYLGREATSTEKDFPVQFIQFDSLKIAYIFGKLSQYSSDNQINMDYLIVSKEGSINIDEIQSFFNFNKIIIDSSMPVWKQDILKKDCELAQIACLNVSENGAFIHTFK